MKNWLFFGLPLGCLGSMLSSFIIVPMLVIILCVSLLPHFGNAGPGQGTNTDTGITQSFIGNKNDAVVNAAVTLVKTLYACGDGHYKCYTGSFPANVLQYLESACGSPSCPYAQSGDFQCVFFVLAVYYMAGQTLPAGPNAVDFWPTYQGLSAWEEIPSNGTPEPGDIAVFSGPSSGPYANPLGHVAIVIDVNGPDPGGHNGYIQLAQANGLKSVENLQLIKTNPGQLHSIWRVVAWDGYNLLGYIRNVANA